MINIYIGNPTAGATDGSLVSTDGSFSSPIQFDLDAAQNESQTVTCAIRTATGYSALDVTVKPVNDLDARFTLSKTAGGSFNNSITFDTVTDSNTLFYLKATSVDTEPPQVIKSVRLQFSGRMKVAS